MLAQKPILSLYLLCNYYGPQYTQTVAVSEFKPALVIFPDVLRSAKAPASNTGYATKEMGGENFI